MSRFVKITIGVLLFLNLILIVLFSMPLAWALGALDYGHSDSYIYAPLEQVSPAAKKIFWQTAGDDFFKKTDVDLSNVLSLVWQDSFKRKTQKPFHQAQSQVVHYLLNNAAQDTFLQKIQATLLVIKFNKFFKPEKLFEVYLNTLPIGQNVYGIGQASAQYFTKPPDQLTTEESAFLIALSQFGSHYDPWRDSGRVQEIQNEILKKF